MPLSNTCSSALCVLCGVTNVNRMFTSLWVVCLALVSSGRSVMGDEESNVLIDQVLDMVRPKIIEENYNEVAIPAFSYGFQYNIWKITIYGTLECSTGSAHSLATVYRTGEADADVYNGSITAEAPLGLRVLVFSFERCSLRVKDLFTTSSSVVGTVGHSSIAFNVSVTPDGTGAVARIDKIDLQDISQIKITTGSNIFAKLRDEIINSVVHKLRATIQDRAKSALKAYEGREFIIKHLPISII